jgi:hypothetical protein
MQKPAHRRVIEGVDLDAKLDRLIEETEQTHERLSDLLGKYQLPSSLVPNLLTAKRSLRAALQHLRAAQVLADQ